jgi:hypothetical protein
MYSREGRPAIPPEKVLSAFFLGVLATIPSARLLMDQLDYDLLLSTLPRRVPRVAPDLFKRSIYWKFLDPEHFMTSISSDLY